MKKLLSALALTAALFVPSAVQAQTTITKTISTSGADCSTTTACAVFSVSGFPSIGVYTDVAASGTFNFEATVAQSSTSASTIWFSIVDDVNAASTQTTDGWRSFSNPGYTYIRVRASAISGTASLKSIVGYSALRSTATLSGSAQGDGTILDGAAPSIKVTVADLANSNPLATMIVNASGDQITSFGGGTQFAEDLAAISADVGTVALAVRRDTAASSSTADGDYSTLNVNASGRLYTSTTIDAALPAGTNGIGKLTTNTGVTIGAVEIAAAQTLATVTTVGSVTSLTNALPAGTNNIGDVDVLTVNGVAPAFNTGVRGATVQRVTIATDDTVLVSDGSGALNVICDSGCSGGTQYAEDTVHVSADSLTLAGVVQQTADAALAGDGDRTLLQVDATGYLKVNVKAGSGSGVSVAEDTASANLDPGTPAYAVRKATPANTSNADGDYEALQISAGRLWVDPSGVTLTVASHAVTNAGTFAVQADTELSAAAAATDNFANPTTAGILSFNMCWDGATWDRCASSLLTEATEDAAETPGGIGTYAMTVRRDAAASSAGTDGDNATLNTDALGRLWVNCGTGCSGGTQYTHDAALTIGSSSTTLAGARASAAVPTDVSADNDAVALWALRSGALAVQPTYAGVLGVTGNGVSGTGVQRVTLASDSTGQVALAAGSATIGALTANQSVNVAQINGVTTLMGNGASGTGAQRVTIANDSTGIISLTTSTASIGKLAANSGVDIGDVDVTTVGTITPGTAATSLGKSEDLAHTTGDVGVMNLAVRRDANSTLVNADGDYAPFQVDANGNLKVAIITGAGSGGTASQDNVAYTPGTTNFTPIGGEVDDTGTSAATENSAAAVRMTVQRAIHVNLRDNAGNELSVGGGTQYNEDDVHASGNKVTMAGVVRQDTATQLAGTDGDNSMLINDASGRLHVNVGNTVTVSATNLSTNVAQINGVTPLMGAGNTGTGSPRVTIATDQAALPGLGIYVEDAAETPGGNLAMSGSVRRDTLATSAGATGDNATINTNAVGALWVSQLDPCSSEAKSTAAFSLTARGVIITAAASKKNYICSFSVVAGAAEIFNIVEGTGTTCQTSTAAIVGSTTAANGLSFAANGGFATAAGNGTAIAGTGTNVDTCIMPSGSNRLSGFVTYVQR